MQLRQQPLGPRDAASPCLTSQIGHVQQMLQHAAVSDSKHVDGLGFIRPSI